MHGQAKVKTSEAEKEKKKERQAIKLKAYREGMEKFSNKRNNKEYDDEALEISADLLEANSGLSTLWNFRKEIILAIKDAKTSEEKTALLNSELRLTEHCLRRDPKSYGAWYHRLWLLDNMPDPDLKTELDLCNKYLKLDERNFHCWDYRRAVVARLGIGPSEELAFTMEKIETNFSNYSSWHYRSILLPLVHPDPAGIRPIDEKTHSEELETVLNAAFTDPYDQSAWFYQRWLLGVVGERTRVVPVQSLAQSSRAYIAFTRSIAPSDVSIEGLPAASEWMALNGQRTSHILVADLTGESSVGPVIVAWKDQKHEINLVEESDKGLGFHYWMKKPEFHPEFSPALVTVLEEQLDMCKQLLALEPDSKWTLLTMALLMHAIDRKKFIEEIMKHLEKLVKVDHLRSAYYCDLRSRFIIENVLEEWDNLDEFTLVDSELTALYHSQHLLLSWRVDLAGNNLGRSLCQLYPLRRCEVLILDRNNISSLEGIPVLPCLTTLSLRNNNIVSLENVVPYLEHFNSLTSLDLTGNPIVENDNDINYITETLSSIRVLNTKEINGQ